MTSNWILIRGLTRGNGHWGDFPKLLQQAGCEVELIEIPGNGTRYNENTPIEPAVLVEDLKKKSKFFSENKIVNLCGISLAGMICLKWAEIYPENLGSVVIINSSLKQLSPFYYRLKPLSYPKLISAILAKSVVKKEKIILSITSNNLDRADFFLNEFSQFSKMHKVTIANFIRQLILANKIVIGSTIQVPVKVICSQKDRLVHPNCSKQIVEMLKAELLIHPLAGHDLPLDDPKWLVSKL